MGGAGQQQPRCPGGTAPVVVQPVRPGNLRETPGAVPAVRRRKRGAVDMKGQGKNPSPCLTCTRVPNPRNCENKQCKLWQRWFLARWALIHTWPRAVMDREDFRPGGVTVGGNTYSHPDAVRRYLATDPCKGCLCPRDLCTTPCRVKETWLKAKEERL